MLQVLMGQHSHLLLNLQGVLSDCFQVSSDRNIIGVLVDVVLGSGKRETVMMVVSRDCKLLLLL